MAKRPRIAVVGSANVDLTTFTDEFPRPGETLFAPSFDLGFGGKAPWPGAEGAQKMAVQYDLDWDRFIRMFVERVTRPVPQR